MKPWLLVEWPFWTVAAAVLVYMETGFFTATAVFILLLGNQLVLSRLRKIREQLDSERMRVFMWNGGHGGGGSDGDKRT